MAKGKSVAESIAKLIRVITVPPFMIALLLAFIGANDFFMSPKDSAAAWSGLVVLPILSYPIHRIIPALYKTGRNGQRKLAFIFSLIGYSGCFVYSFFSSDPNIKFLFGVYFATAVILTLVNKLLHIRASGHSASAVSPCIFSLMYSYVGAFVFFAALFLLSVWASLFLKRHKIADIAAGLCSFFAAFGISILIETLYVN
ncbi:MAG: hypothetical protein IJG50_04010 [Clostridia bacterium]|nr:hypothetical protein [Clostridia bacterium]